MYSLQNSGFMQENDQHIPDVESAETPQNNEVETTEGDKIAQLQQQLEESRAKYLYLLSDFENFKRNAAKERMELMSTAGRDILAALIPVLDDFDRAAKNDGLSDGMILIHQKLAQTLQNKGLAVKATQIGDEFNPDFHEALAEVPVQTDDLKGKIVDILDQAYTLGERILRFGKVVVGR
jgi:molecular chaperone GrpE